MRLDRNKFGFTLAEVMVVLLVLSIIFAAFAPLVTKRRASSNRSKYAVWNWAEKTDSTSGPRNAYYEPGDTSYTGTALFGITPETGADVSALSPDSSRVVIRSLANLNSNQIQRQVQFRYGGTSDSTLAGTWLMDMKNVLLGGSYTNMKYNRFTTYLARNNLAIGYNALNSMGSGTVTTSAKDNVGVGYEAGKSISNNDQNNTYVGYQAGANSTGKRGRTFIGSKAGTSNSGNYNTAVGYQAGTSSSGNYNTFIGVNSGLNATGSYNYGQGYNALKSLTSGSYNVAIGSGALQNLTTGSNNVAIGYNACSQVTTGSYKTCIGANSGPKSNTTAAYLGGITDDVQRTYIGSTPKEYYGGDAVLEIHNVGGTNDVLANSPSVRSNTTTVINGNLIVRGRLFFTSGTKLYAVDNTVDVLASDLKNGLGYRKGHNSSRPCSDQTSDYYNKSYCPTLQSTSDRRLKNIGSKNNDGLDKISQLKVFNYNFKADKNRTPQVGVIAQQLQKVFPNAVFEGEDGYLKIRWDEIFYSSINAIVQLDKKIVKLVQQATNLENKITKLEKQNSELKLQVADLTNRVEALKKK